MAHVCESFKFGNATRNFITQIGLLGVQFFFVISGFLITTLLLKEKIETATISLKKFYVRRIFRILPVALLYLLCLSFLNLLFHLEVPFKCFIGAAFFLANLNFFHGSWYTAHYWSLSVEEQYYLGFPFLLKKFGLNTHFIIIFVLLVIIFFKEAAYLQFNIFPTSNILNNVAFVFFQSDGVLIGSLISILWFKNYIPVNLLKKFNPALSLLLPVPIVIIYTNVIRLHSFNSIISSLLISVLMVCNILNRDTMLYRFLNRKYMTTLGKLSFSIYIWQQLFTTTDGKFGSLARLPLNLLLIMVVSYLSYFFYEKKFLRMKAKFKMV